MSTRPPQTIYIIRHAEKQPTSGETIPEPQASLPEYGPPTNGVDVAGSQAHGSTDPGKHSFDPTKDSLIPRGWQRAGALATLFATLPRYGGPFEQPDRIVAAAYPPADPKHPKHSAKVDLGLTYVHRPYQTVQPLAERLGLEIDVRHQVGAEQGAMTDVMGTGGVVLICWEHDHIFVPGSTPTGLVAHIPPDAGPWPTHAWSGKHFDLVWCFELNTATGRYAWIERGQDVLCGDQPA